MAMSFDFRARTLALPVDDDWEPEIREQAIGNQNSIKEQLIHDFGAEDFTAKIENFVALDVAPISVIAVHNDLLDQCRRAFVSGAFYASLVGACALGERILNAVILQLRDNYFAHHEATKYVQKKSIDNWTKAIDTLQAWEVLSQVPASNFRKLATMRHKSVHYQLPHLHETGGRQEALEAIHLIQGIISALFEAFGAGDQFIAGSQGATFLRRDAEERPLIREFYIPACVLVSPEHEYVNFGQPGMRVVDNVEFASDHGIQSLTDDEFVYWDAQP